MKTYYEKSLRFKELKTSKVQTASKAGDGGDLLGLFWLYALAIGSLRGAQPYKQSAALNKAPSPSQWQCELYF